MNGSDLFRRVRRIYGENGIRGIVKAGAARASADLRLRFEWNPVASALDCLSAQPTFSLVQLGAHVGNTANDPLYRFLSKQFGPGRKERKAPPRVVLVEPVKSHFERLQANYAMFHGLDFANVAIADAEGVRDFHTLGVDPTRFGYPAWLSQLSSLKAERMDGLWDRNGLYPEYKAFYLKHRVVEKVKCVTLGQLLDQYHIEQLDFLQIDVEGYEFEILQTLDFGRVKPRFINYERELLYENELPCRRMLENAGYTLTDWGQDTFCARRD